VLRGGFVEVDRRKLGKRIHGAPVVAIEEARRFPGPLAPGAVAGAAGRAEVRAEAIGSASTSSPNRRSSPAGSRDP